eukprot:2955964-Rhodomonas_salina.1
MRKRPEPASAGALPTSRASLAGTGALPLASPWCKAPTRSCSASQVATSPASCHCILSSRIVSQHLASSPPASFPLHCPLIGVGGIQIHLSC